MKYVTSLKEIRSLSPFKEMWEILLKSQGVKKSNSKPLHILTVLNELGIQDTLWCLRVFGEDPQVRRYAAWCARQVLHIFEAKFPADKRPRMAIEAAEAYAQGEISAEELVAAGEAAGAAGAGALIAMGKPALEASTEAGAAGPAAEAAAWAAGKAYPAESTARAAAVAASWGAAEATAGDAAKLSAWSAANEAALAAQKAKLIEMFSE